MAQNSEVQWGVRSDGQPGDGEDIRTGDLNAMQRLLAARMADWLHPVPTFYGLRSDYTVSPLTTPLAICYAVGHGGFPVASATTRTITNRAGVIAQKLTVTPDGLTPAYLVYHLAADELASQLSAGHATLNRIDSVFVKLDEAGANDAGTLLTAQAIHQKAATPPYDVTTQNYYSRLRVRCTKSVVEGTPGATPAPPATPSGYTRFCDVYVAATWNAVVDPLDIRDHRLPERLVWRRYNAKQWNSSTWTVNTDLQLASAASGNQARMEFDRMESPHLSRVLALGFNIKTSVAGFIARVHRFRLEAPAHAISESELGNLDGDIGGGIAAADAGVFSDQGLWGAGSVPLWGSGYRAGPAMFEANGTFGTQQGPHAQLGLFIQATAAADKVYGVWTLTAEP